MFRNLNNKYLKLFACIFLLVIIACSSPSINNNARIEFNCSDHNFGIFPFRKEAEYSFQFTNPGKTPLVIFDVKTSCGCTVPEWSKKPAKPGMGGEIKVKYDAVFPGVFHKTITVHYNGKESPVTLSIKGQVEYPDDLEGAVE